MQLNKGSFESDRFYFEPRKATHGAEVFPYLTEEDLYHYTSSTPPISVTWLTERFKNLESQVSPDRSELWLGWIGKEKLNLNPVGLFEATLKGLEVSIAYTVFKPFWGQGVAVEGTEAMIAHLSTYYSIDNFIIEMDTRHRRSIRVAEKLGFRFVQVVNNAGFLKGMVSHEFVYEKTKPTL